MVIIQFPLLFSLGAFQISGCTLDLSPLPIIPDNMPWVKNEVLTEMEEFVAPIFSDHKEMQSFFPLLEFWLTF